MASKVSISEGNFSIAAKLTASGTAVGIQGMGRKSTKLNLAYNGDMLEVNVGNSKATGLKYLAHLAMVGNSVTYTSGIGLSLISAEDLWVTNCWITDFPYDGIRLEVPAAGTPDAQALIRFFNNRIDLNKRNGIYVGAGCDGIHVLSNELGDNGTSGQPYYNLFINRPVGRQSVGDVMVKDNAIWQSKNANMVITGCIGSIIEGNYFLSTPVENLIIGGTTVEPAYLISVIGNYFHSCAETTHTAYHIQLGTGASDFCSQVVVTGNQFSQPAAITSGGVLNEDSNSFSNLVQGNAINGNFPTITITGTGSKAKDNIGWVTENHGLASNVTLDGSGIGAIAHGCDATPTYANVICASDNLSVKVTSIDATNINILVKDLDGTVVTADTHDFYWEAK